jgi:hypothetical protein
LLTDFDALTFDCYGTLIDWESGILEALKSLTDRAQRPVTRDQILEDVVVQSPLRRLDPRFDPIALPMLGPELDQHDPGCLNEQSAQITIAAL